MELSFTDVAFEEDSQGTKDLRIRQITTLNKVVGNLPDKFYGVTFIDYKTVLEKIEAFFDNPSSHSYTTCENYTLETRKSYMGCLCKALRIIDIFPADSFVQYQKYLDKISVENLKEHVERTVGNINPNEFLNTQKIVYTKRCKNDNLCIIIKLITLIDITKNYYGILRMHDLVNIAIAPELKDQTSYLDINTGELTILASCTKNKTERTFKVPEDFCELVKLIQWHDRGRRKWLLCRSYESKHAKFGKTSELGKLFKDFMGMKYYTVRHQFVTYLHKNADMKTTETIAFNMGHSLKVAMRTYNDRYHDHESDSSDQDE